METVPYNRYKLDLTCARQEGRQNSELSIIAGYVVGIILTASAGGLAALIIGGLIFGLCKYLNKKEKQLV